jgi:hypothetical protein
MFSVQSHILPIAILPRSKIYGLIKDKTNININRVLHVTICMNKLTLIMEFADLGCLDIYLHNRRPASVGETLALGQLEMAKIAQMVFF